MGYYVVPRRLGRDEIDRVLLEIASHFYSRNNKNVKEAKTKISYFSVASTPDTAVKAASAADAASDSGIVYQKINCQ